MVVETIDIFDDIGIRNSFKLFCAYAAQVNFIAIIFTHLWFTYVHIHYSDLKFFNSHSPKTPNNWNCNRIFNVFWQSQLIFPFHMNYLQSNKLYDDCILCCILAKMFVEHFYSIAHCEFGFLWLKSLLVCKCKVHEKWQ